MLRKDPRINREIRRDEGPLVSQWVFIRQKSSNKRVSRSELHTRIAKYVEEQIQRTDKFPDT